MFRLLIIIINIGDKMYASVKEFENVKLSGDLEKDIALFKNIFKKEAIFRVKRIKVRNTVAFDCAMIYLSQRRKRCVWGANHQ